MAKKKTHRKTASGSSRSRKAPMRPKAAARKAKPKNKPKADAKRKAKPAARPSRPAAAKKADAARKTSAQKKARAQARPAAPKPAKGPAPKKAARVAEATKAKPRAPKQTEAIKPLIVRRESPAKKVAPVKPPASPKAPATAAPVAAPQPAPSLPAAPAKKAAPRPAKPLKERVVMEFAVHSNPNVLFELLSTPSGFSEWYCDDVDLRGDHFTFKWSGDEESATVIGRKAPEVIRFRRDGEEDPAAFFEFRVRIDDMTNEVALIVTDHAWPGDVENLRSLWASQIANLVRVLGA